MFWSAFSVRKRRPKQSFLTQVQLNAPELTVAAKKLFFLQRALPFWLMYLRHAAQQQPVVRNVTGYRRASSDRHVITDSNGRDKLGIRSDENIIADNRFMFIHTVVVAGNGTRADVDVIANVRIAEVREVPGF